MTFMKFALIIILTLAGAAIQSVAAQTGTLQGTVGVSSDNRQSERLPGANLTLAPIGSVRKALSTVTNDQGEYKFTGLVAGQYTLRVDLNGFKALTQNVTIRAGVTTQENINLELEGISGEVTVAADGDGSLDTTATGQAASFKQERLQTTPLVNERFQDALPLIPGVLRGPDGQLNLKGARAGQSAYMVNSADVTDPITGEFAFNLPLEAVQSV